MCTLGQQVHRGQLVVGITVPWREQAWLDSAVLLSLTPLHLAIRHERCSDDDVRCMANSWPNGSFITLNVESMYQCLHVVAVAGGAGQLWMAPARLHFHNSPDNGVIFLLISFTACWFRRTVEPHATHLLYMSNDHKWVLKIFIPSATVYSAYSSRDGSTRHRWRMSSQVCSL